MWKGGSEQQLVTPFPVDPVDRSRSGRSGACPKVGARLHETLLLGNPLFHKHVIYNEFEGSTSTLPHVFDVDLPEWCKIHTLFSDML